jgi:hypothetical protein
MYGQTQDKIIRKFIYKLAASSLCDVVSLPYRHLKFDAKRICDLWKTKPRRYVLKSLGIAASDLALPVMVALGIAISNPRPDNVMSAFYMVSAFFFNSIVSADYKEKRTGFEAAPRINSLLRNTPGINSHQNTGPV